VRKSLLVTGGTGFIGSHLAESARKKGLQVRVLGMTDVDADRKNAEYLRSLGVEVFSGSVADPDLCASAMEGVSDVYHLAVAMREGGMSDEGFTEINLTGTKFLLDAALASSVNRFIYCSTIGIFGHRVPGITSELSDFNPGNIYERTKLEAEKLALSYYEKHNLPVVSLRPADVYGPRDQRLLKLFGAVRRGRFPLFGKGEGRRHMVYIDDVVSAFEIAAESESALGKAFIIAGPEICTLRELIELVRDAASAESFGYRLPLAPMLALAAIVEDACSLIGVSPPIYRRRMDFFHSDSAFDISYAKKVLEWKPKVSLRDGVRLTMKSYIEDGLFDA
jgi:nucleoside-diphosphate-sugar epimerase